MTTKLSEASQFIIPTSVRTADRPKPASPKYYSRNATHTEHHYLVSGVVTMHKINLTFHMSA